MYLQSRFTHISAVITEHIKKRYWGKKLAKQKQFDGQ